MAEQILIAGVNRIHDVLLEDLTIEQVLTHMVDTCSFCIKNQPPGEGDEVIIEVAGTRFFGGIVDSVRLKRSAGTLNIWQVDCQDYTYQLNRRLVVETYENRTADWIVKDILLKYGQEMFTSTNIQVGAPTVEYICFDYLPPSECLKKLADYCGWEWYVDYYRDVWFFDPMAGTQPAPMTITSDTEIRNLAHRLDTQGLRNRVYIKGGTMLSDPFTYEVKSDGNARIWTLPHKSHNLSLAISGSPVTVGIENVTEEATVGYLMNYQDKYVKASSRTATPADGATLTFTYQYDINVISMVDDFESQAAIASVQGGDGVYEHVIHDTSLTTIEAAEAAGMADLRNNANPRVRGSFETEIPGWVPGQLLTIDLPNRGIQNTFLVQKVSISPLTPTVWSYHVEYGGRLIGIPDFLQAIVSAQQTQTSTETQLLNKFIYDQDLFNVTDEIVINQVELPFKTEVSASGIFDPYSTDLIYREDSTSDFQQGWLTGVMASNGSLTLTSQQPGNRVITLDLSRLGIADQTKISWDAVDGPLLDEPFTAMNPRWINLYTDTPGLTTFILNEPTATDGKCLRVSGGVGWFYWNGLIPYQPDRLYVIKARFRQAVDPTVGGPNCYLGVEGIAADGVTLVNTVGSNTHSGQFYYGACGTALTSTGGWQTFIGYIRGYSSTVLNMPYPNPNSPGPMGNSVAYIRPMFIVNYLDGNGTADIDYVVLEYPGDVTVETNLSLNGGSSWDGWLPVTNSGSVPGITQGLNLQNARLQVRQSLSTDIQGLPRLDNFTLTVEGTREPISTIGSLFCVMPIDTGPLPMIQIATSPDGIKYLPWTAIEPNKSVAVPYPGYVKLKSTARIRYYNAKLAYDETGVVCDGVVVS
ncbi:hypothetical protein H1S01_15325 [Heliobacterium chlorum]|uniref:Uncharacterized protein n=1 Tax=Heliobacterium chlorum TaxID=2698 RepID=A0ABR7T8C5_HELCL|nr:hypothetical protein [Heliobacterium chlorum]MBC9785856.1 hypothetical protein [Heliobacterium chlorum]